MVFSFYLFNSGFFLLEFDGKAFERWSHICVKKTVKVTGTWVKCNGIACKPILFQYTLKSYTSSRKPLTVFLFIETRIRIDKKIFKCFSKYIDISLSLTFTFSKVPCCFFNKAWKYTRNCLCSSLHCVTHVIFIAEETKPIIQFLTFLFYNLHYSFIGMVIFWSDTSNEWWCGLKHRHNILAFDLLIIGHFSHVVRHAFINMSS